MVIRRASEPLNLLMHQETDNWCRAIDRNLASQAAATGALQSQVTTLQGQVSTLQASLTTLQGQVTSLEAAVTSLQASVTSLSASVASLQAAVTTLTSHVSGLATHAAAQDTTINALCDWDTELRGKLPAAFRPSLPVPSHVPPLPPW